MILACFGINLYLDVFSPQHHWCGRGYGAGMHFGTFQPNIKCFGKL